MKLDSVVTQMVVYPAGKNPIYDEGSFTITITDEAGGPFLLISQISDVTLETNELRVELEELDMIYSQAHIMLQNYEKAMRMGGENESGKDQHSN